MTKAIEIEMVDEAMDEVEDGWSIDKVWEDGDSPKSKGCSNSLAAIPATLRSAAILAERTPAYTAKSHFPKGGLSLFFRHPSTLRHVTTLQVSLLIVIFRQQQGPDVLIGSDDCTMMV